jgi:DNA-binding HxlR family transcriptional regulator
MSRRTKEELKNELMLTLKDQEQTWGELQQKYKSPATLSKALNELIKEGKITAEPDPSDRRITRYRAVPEKVDIHIRRYRIVRFLENLKNPSCKEESTKHENYEITASCFIEGEPKQKIDREWKTLHISWIEMFIPQLFEHFRKAGVKISKIALTVTAEEKQ